MEEGKRYIVAFNQHNGRRNNKMEMVAEYQGDTRFGEHVFSLRPLAGTTTISPDVLVGETIETTGKIALPHRAA